jgi:hypothetical protein
VRSTRRPRPIAIPSRITCCDLFEKLMHDEEEHIDFLETQLDLVAKLGAGLYAQHHTKMGTVVSVFSWRAGLPRGPQSWSSSSLTPTNISTAGTYFDQAAKLKPDDSKLVQSAINGMLAGF